METLPPPVSRRDPVPGNGRPWPDPRFETLERLAAALDRLAAALEGMRRLADPPSAPSAGPSWPAEPTVAGAASPQPTLLGILEQRGFVVKGMALPSDEAEPMNRLAWFLGERHALLRSQLRKIRAAMNNGLRCSVDLADASAEEISANCQFATSARDLGLLEEFQYVRHPRRVLHLVCNRDPAALNFFSGGWLERYLEEGLRRAQPGIVDVQRNTVVTLPTGEDFELDLLALDGRGRPLWVEAKTGEFVGSLPKYARVRDQLGVPIDRAILVLPEVQDAACRALRTQHGLHAVNLGGWNRLLPELAAAQ